MELSECYYQPIRRLQPKKVVVVLLTICLVLSSGKRGRGGGLRDRGVEKRHHNRNFWFKSWIPSEPRNFNNCSNVLPSAPAANIFSIKFIDRGDITTFLALLTFFFISLRINCVANWMQNSMASSLIHVAEINGINGVESKKTNGET
uniref:Uncharacterized protein n=1 Tax=Cannabis sativa TaxID=3483 RepID=A0A803NZR9_CANSA